MKTLATVTLREVELPNGQRCVIVDAGGLNQLSRLLRILAAAQTVLAEALEAREERGIELAQDMPATPASVPARGPLLKV